MENWQIMYLIILSIGLLIGWYLSPLFGVVFVWAAVLIYEFRHYLEEVREFELKSEED